MMVMASMVDLDFGSRWEECSCFNAKDGLRFSYLISLLIPFSILFPCGNGRICFVEDHDSI